MTIRSGGSDEHDKKVGGAADGSFVETAFTVEQVVDAIARDEQRRPTSRSIVGGFLRRPVVGAGGPADG